MVKCLNFILVIARTPVIVFSALDRALTKVIEGIGAATLVAGSLARLIHTGRIQQHLAFALIALAAATAWLVLQ